MAEIGRIRENIGPRLWALLLSSALILQFPTAWDSYSVVEHLLLGMGMNLITNLNSAPKFPSSWGLDYRKPPYGFGRFMWFMGGSCQWTCWCRSRALGGWTSAVLETARPSKAQHWLSIGEIPFCSRGLIKATKTLHFPIVEPHFMGLMK